MSEPCSICGGSKDEHEILNHEFNLHNQLIPKVRPTPKQQVQRVPTVIGGIDLELRHILLEKGIINNADFTALRNPGGSTPGDREAGEAPSSE
jgi:hypothetical protein